MVDAGGTDVREWIVGVSVVKETRRRLWLL